MKEEQHRAIANAIKILKAIESKERSKQLKNNPKLLKIEQAIKRGQELLKKEEE